MAESFLLELIENLVREHVEWCSGDLRIEQVATGKFNTTYSVDGAGRPLVVRIAPADDAGFVFYEKGMMAQEPGIHKIVRERTSAPVPEILAYDSSRRLIDRDFLIMERLPGQPLTYFTGTHQQHDNVLRQIGTFLRMIHGITATQYGYLGEHHCMEPQPDWGNAFRVMWNKMVDDIVGAGYYDGGEEAYVRGMLEKYFHLFDRPVTSRLLHMDIWSQNILVDDDGAVTGIIDFDRALWGDKEIEFAVLDYCAISEPAFWEGYGIPRDNSEPARIRQVFYLLYEIQKYIVIYYYRNRDPIAAQVHKDKTMQLLSTL